ncbi:hypothetical protein M1N24_00505 [Dehalococcoidia bacterium]|nr:hypothetical protein [Dehalococcoidia bacterium]
MTIGVALALLCLMVVGAPLVKRRRTSSRYMEDPIIKLDEQRTEIYQEITTMANDYSIGQITQAEYERRLLSLRISAATLLKEQEILQSLSLKLDDTSLDNISDISGYGHVPLCLKCGKQMTYPFELCPHCNNMPPQTTPNQ